MLYVIINVLLRPRQYTYIAIHTHTIHNSSTPCCMVWLVYGGSCACIRTSGAMNLLKNLYVWPCEVIQCDTVAWYEMHLFAVAVHVDKRDEEIDPILLPPRDLWDLICPPSPEEVNLTLEVNDISLFLHSREGESEQRRHNSIPELHSSRSRQYMRHDWVHACSLTPLLAEWHAKRYQRVLIADSVQAFAFNGSC